MGQITRITTITENIFTFNFNFYSCHSYIREIRVPEFYNFLYMNKQEGFDWNRGANQSMTILL